MAKNKNSAAKKTAKAVKAADADVRPCLVPDRHTNECDCYGPTVAVRDSGPDSDT